MSWLFKIEDKRVFPNPETLMIYPFSEIWERDSSPGKETAVKELSYIEFMSSMMRSNPYREYGEDRKELVILQEVVRDPDWKPDKLISEGIKKIQEFQTEGSATYRYWLANLTALEKQIEFFNTVDIQERNFKTGNPIYKAKDIPDAVAIAERVLTSHTALKNKVDEELFESTKMRSQKTISPFANPESLRSK